MEPSTDDIINHLKEIRGSEGDPQYEGITKAIVMLGGGVKRAPPTKG